MTVLLTMIRSMLLTFSFPYPRRDWLNEHPFRNTPEARLICSLNNGAPNQTRGALDSDETT